MQFGFRYHLSVMKRVTIPLLVALVLIGGLCFVGCETESASENNVRITPSSAIILIDEAIELNASGGFDYEWSLQNEEWGTLSTTIGPSTIYTSAYNPSAEAWQEHQVVTVRSYINKQAGTNTFDYSQTAEAVITHQTAQGAVQISPANAALDAYESVTFTASGANRYSWSLRQPVYGQLTATEGPTTTYTSTIGPGEETLQILTCTTDRGTTSAHILHNPDELTITPASAQLSPDESINFTAAGGDGTYTWGIDDGSLAQYSPAAGRITTVTAKPSVTSSNATVLTVTSGGEKAYASIQFRD